MTEIIHNPCTTCMCPTVKVANCYRKASLLFSMCRAVQQVKHDRKLQEMAMYASYLLLNANPQGTCEEAKACEYRKS